MEFLKGILDYHVSWSFAAWILIPLFCVGCCAALIARGFDKIAARRENQKLQDDAVHTRM
jgi:hypothetical protein